MRNLHVVGVVIVLVGCAARAASDIPQVAAPNSRPDSIVLRRTPCLGTCPVYRLRLSSTGQVAFNDGDVKTDTVPVAVVDALLAYANAMDIRSLPDTIDHGSGHCRDYATDHPSIEVSLFGAEPKHMHYYTGCYTGAGFHAVSNPMHAVKAFAARMDTLTGATRWIRPASRR